MKITKNNNNNNNEMKNVWMYEMNKQLIFCSFIENNEKPVFLFAIQNMPLPLTPTRCVGNVIRSARKQVSTFT